MLRDGTFHKESYIYGIFADGDCIFRVVDFLAEVHQFHETVLPSTDAARHKKRVMTFSLRMPKIQPVLDQANSEWRMASKAFVFEGGSTSSKCDLLPQKSVQYMILMMLHLLVTEYAAGETSIGTSLKVLNLALLTNSMKADCSDRSLSLSLSFIFFFLYECICVYMNAL